MASRLFKSAVLVMALAPVACTSSQEKARARLGAMNIPYSDDSFVDRAAAGDKLVVRDFLASGMKPDVTSKEGKTPLVAAAEAGRVEVAELLLQSGAHINATDRTKSRSTPIIIASAAGQTEVVRLLLAKGAEKNARDAKTGMNALLSASMRGSRDVAKLLLDGGVRVDDADNDGRTPLMWASMSGRADLIKMLLEHGADLKARDKTHGADPLIVAAANGRTTAALLLLDKGANPGVADVSGKTALMWAAKNGHADTVKLLLDHGGDPSAKDRDGKTAAQIAKESNKPTVEAFLKSVAAARS